MAEKRKLALALSLDVEEEGLFRGSYSSAKPQISNISELTRLEPFFERGLKATFFCAHCALTDSNARKTLELMRDRHGVEIGAHLHHWNTPPLGAPAMFERVPAAAVPQSGLRAKLETLFAAARDFQGRDVNVFRMGRWDLHKMHWPLLLDLGVKYDASIRPLHAFHFPEGPDHFDAPADPYRLASGEICEVPLTCVPLLESFRSVGSFRTNLRKWGALALLPVEHPLWLMKLTTLLHAARGGKTLSLTWHSSEMMPGGSPKMRDENAVRLFLDKVLAWLSWLDETFTMEYLTISQMGLKYAQDSPAVAENADWNFSDQGRSQ